MIKKYWYAAVDNEEYPDWDFGSYDLTEAIEKAKEFPHGYIAIIDEADNFCVGEIPYPVEDNHAPFFGAAPDVDNDIAAPRCVYIIEVFSFTGGTILDRYARNKRTADKIARNCPPGIVTVRKANPAERRYCAAHKHIEG